jgi:hypothetical protein
MVRRMASTKTIWIVGGLLAAGSLSLAGCGTTRSETRAQSGWNAVLFPWRAAESEVLTESPEPPSFDPSLRSAQPESAATDPDEYYQPRSSVPRANQPFVPPPAPPASEPGFFESELETSGNPQHSTSQPLSPTPAQAEPSRLRDLFESVRGRRAAPPVQRIPLDGPVATTQQPSNAYTVGFDIPEPVLLGRPDFE